MDEASAAYDYEEFLQDLHSHYLVKQDPRRFFTSHTSFRSPIAGGYGIVNFVRDPEGRVMVVKAVRNISKRHKELYWLWKFREFPGYVKLLYYFESSIAPPPSWSSVDASTESVWLWPSQLFIVMEYYPLTLRDFVNNSEEEEQENEDVFLFTDEFIVDFFWELFYCIYYGRVLLGYFQHLDIAVRNILVSQDETTRVYMIRGRRVNISSPYRPVLIDFGISQGPWSLKKLDLEWSNSNTKKGIDIDCISIMSLLSHVLFKYQHFCPLPLSKRMRNNLTNFIHANERVCEGDEIRLMEELLLLPNTFTHTLEISSPRQVVAVQKKSPPLPPPTSRSPPPPRSPRRVAAAVSRTTSPPPPLSRPLSPPPPPLLPTPPIEMEKKEKDEILGKKTVSTRASIIPFHFKDTASPFQQ